jgi:hypothetical protein
MYYCVEVKGAASLRDEKIRGREGALTMINVT